MILTQLREKAELLNSVDMSQNRDGQQHTA
jgi:hypothetical protein